MHAWEDEEYDAFVDANAALAEAIRMARKYPLNDPEHDYCDRRDLKIVLERALAVIKPETGQ